MRDIALPEVKLPEIRLPDGLREMTLDDIVQAAQGRVQAAQVSLPKKADLPNVDLPKVDLPKVELPKQIADRLAGRRRPNPILPIAGILAVGAVIAGAIWLVTSPVTGPRVRHAVDDLRNRMTGRRTDLIRYDEEDDLGSLLTEPTADRSSMTLDPFASSGTASGLGNGVPVGPGELPEGVARG